MVNKNHIIYLLTILLTQNNKMKKEQKTNKMNYMAPQVEAMEARVEKGYFLSSGQSGNGITEEMTEAGSATWG